VPTPSLLIGSSIVVATGLFLFLREARLQQAIAAGRLRPRDGLGERIAGAGRQDATGG
jgi:hypothetical protein